jgi:MFS family permease
VALISFFQSSFLNQYLSEAQIGSYVSLAYIIALISLIYFGWIIKRIGLIKSILIVILIDLVGLILMAYYNYAWAAILGVIIYEVTLTLIYLIFDILIKQNTDTSLTGNVRGFYLTILIIAWIISPALAGWLILHHSFGILFKISIIIMLLISLLIIIFGKSLKAEDHQKFLISLKEIYRQPDVFKIFMVSFFLQVFLCGMVIYMPLYLYKDVGLGWQQIGIIFTVMLCAYLLIDYPAGKLADKYWGEKEMLIAGILIASLSSLIIFYNTSTAFGVWIALMFLTRVGSSLMEIMTETYFFKKINDQDVGVINFYRTASPLAYIVGPLFFSALLYFYPLKIVFLALGLLMIIPLYWAVTLKDTK